MTNLLFAIGQATRFFHPGGSDVITGYRIHNQWCTQGAQSLFQGVITGALGSANQREGCRSSRYSEEDDDTAPFSSTCAITWSTSTPICDGVVS